MPKKVKKGRGKAEEGRLVQQQERAQAVEEMNRKEEMLTLFLKDKLQKEQRNTAVNWLKLTEVWRSTLRQSREVELRAEVEVQRQAFERQLDDRDSVIEVRSGSVVALTAKPLQEDLLNLQKLRSLLTEKTEKNQSHRRSIDRLQVSERVQQRGDRTADTTLLPSLRQAASQRLKDTLSRVKTENRLQAEEQRAARDELKKKCQQLQDWLTQTRCQAGGRLARLSVQGDNASTKLQAAISKVCVCVSVCVCESHSSSLSCSSRGRRFSVSEKSAFSLRTTQMFRCCRHLPRRL
uniref:Dynein regulatory complex subunit 2 n=1 Tax=Salarias fasciatus TaxID=181472 RepID=A0A672F323_SALFA